MSITKEREDWDFCKSNCCFCVLKSKISISWLYEFSKQKFNIILETKVQCRDNSFYSYTAGAKQNLHNQQEVTQSTRSLQHYTEKEETPMYLYSLCYICNEVWNFSRLTENTDDCFTISLKHTMHISTIPEDLNCSVFLACSLKSFLGMLILKNPQLSTRDNIGMILSTLLVNRRNYAIGMISKSLKILSTWKIIRCMQTLYCSPCTP